MAELDTSGQVQEFLSVLKRRKWGIVLPMLYFLAVGLLIAVVVPKQVEVMTRVELKETRVESDPNLKTPQNNAATKEIRSAVHHIRHYNRIKHIIENDLQDHWELDYMGLNSGDKYKYIIDVVMKNLMVHVEEKANTRNAAGSWFINIAYKDVNGPRAEEFLNRLVDHWVDDVIERDAVQLEEEHKQLIKAYNDAETKANEASAKYEQICKTLGFDPSLDLDTVQRVDDSVSSVLAAQQSRKEELSRLKLVYQTRIVQKSEERQDMPVTIKTETTIPGVDNTDKIEVLENQIRVMEDLIEEKGWTRFNKKREKAEEAIEKLRINIEELAAANVPDLIEPTVQKNPELEKIDAEIRQLENDLDTTEQELTLVTLQVSRLVEEQRRETRNRNRLFELFRERKSAWVAREEIGQLLDKKKLAVEAVKSTYNKPYEVVQPPNAEGAPTTPNTSILVVFCAIAGLGIGLAFSLLSEYGKNAYRSPHELAQVLPIPVLGAVNSIVTSAQSRRRHARRTLVAVSSLLILGGLGWFTYMVWQRESDLPVQVQQTIEDIRMMLL